MAFLILIILVAKVHLAGLLDFIHNQTWEWQSFFPPLCVLHAAHEVPAYTEKDPPQDKLMWQLCLWVVYVCNVLLCF